MVAVAAICLLAAAKAPPAVFDEITVGRINVREPDGRLLVNDDGTENGGLIQKGFVGPDGKADAGLSLTFDRFRQDQVIQLLHAEGGGRARSMLVRGKHVSGPANATESRDHGGALG